ncbi:E3 ubiquitin-protein ligase RNF180 isoform X5 [Vidua macroura]|uniref:E3 ubiquitin-protein ligase RNF180 isoform X5 n=1 Tax=Vidua macroura TaxID=187451 RepID=UPI0023A912B7|nr:E3 ubiquitin-protein ligase RNF180 isoform X5 [Vidua macroura]
MNNQEAGVLCCWRCRKYIANSGFFAKCNGKKTSKISQPSAAAQNSCNVWHVSLEAIPEWVKCLIEKAQWTIGKLHCPFCEACLGGFNFVCNKECSCGQLVNIHFFKTWTENPVKLSKSSEKHLLLKIQSGFNKDTCHEVVTATLEIINQGLSYTAGSNNGAGRLTEVLCLEERAPRYKIESKKLPLKALNQKRNLPSSYLIKDTCTAKPFHRRSCSLDLNIRERLVLSSVLYETCSMGTLYCGQNENPSAYVQGSLQLESSRKDGSSFQYLYSSRADILQNKFQVTSVTTLLHGDTESECDFEVTGQCSGSVIADGSPFVMNLSLPARAVEDKQYITPGGLAQPMSISFNQKLSKRERNKSKSLRRKRRRREQCLQKQVTSGSERCYEVSLEPFLQDEQLQLSETVLKGEMLQPSDQLSSSALKTSGYFSEITAGEKFLETGVRTMTCYGEAGRPGYANSNLSLNCCKTKHVTFSRQYFL